jgi:hypothetical protein
MLTADSLTTAVADLQTAVGKLSRQIAQADGTPELDVALALVQLDKLRKNVQAVGKRLAAASANGKE